MYALVEINGKQYKAEKGSVIKVDKFSAEPGTSMNLDKVLVLSGESEVKIGNPYVVGASITATLKDNVKGKKVQVFKMKRRKGYRRSQGHRQNYSLLIIEDIAGV